MANVTRSWGCEIVLFKFVGMRVHSSWGRINLDGNRRGRMWIIASHFAFQDDFNRTLFMRNPSMMPKKTEKKYSDMLNMKALVGIRIAFMGKEFEWWVFWLFFIRKEFISVWSTCKNYCFFKTYNTVHGVHGVHRVHGGPEVWKNSDMRIKTRKK